MSETNKISDVIRNEGIPLWESSKGGRFRCPFHDDTHPSAFAYRDSNRFICFGCGAQGDAIDFVMKLKGVSFRKALSYLDIDRRWKKGANDRWRRKKDLLNGFRGWERKYYDRLALVYRSIRKLMKRFKTMEQVEEFAVLYHELPLIEHWMDILLFGTDEEKYKLFKEVNGEL